MAVNQPRYASRRVDHPLEFVCRAVPQTVLALASLSHFASRVGNMKVELLANQGMSASKVMELRRHREVVEMWLASEAPQDCRTQLEELLLSVDLQLREVEAEMNYVDQA